MRRPSEWLRQKSTLVFEQDGMRYRAIGPGDLETIRCWRNEDETRSQFVFTGLLTPQNQADWFERYREDDTDVMFLVEAVAKESETHTPGWSHDWIPVGCAALYHIDEDNREAEFGRLMIGHPDYRGKGLGRRITEALTAFGLSRMGLHRVYLEVYQDNPAALKSYMAAGYTLLPEQRTVNGRVLVKLERQKNAAAG